MTSDLGNKEIMAKNIKRFLDSKGITGKDLALAIGVPPTTLYSWLQAAAYPRIDKIEMMANYFGITKADLVEDEENLFQSKLEEVFRDRPEMRVLFSTAKDCTTDQIELAIAIIEAMRDKNMNK